jgi:hypothetical protein
MGMGVIVSTDWVVLASLFETLTATNLSHLHIIEFHCLLISNLRHQYVDRLQ